MTGMKTTLLALGVALVFLWALLSTLALSCSLLQAAPLAQNTD